MADGSQPLADWRVTLDGRDLTDRLRPLLVSLTLTEKRGGEADELEILINDIGGSVAIPDDGAILSVALGWTRPPPGQTAGLVEKGRFRVDEVSWSGPPDAIAIRARSADLSEGFTRRRDRAWQGKTIGAILSAIATDQGLTARVHPSLAGLSVDPKEQAGKSDAAFLKALGERYDAVATVKDRVLIFAPINAGTSASGKALPVVTIPRAAGNNHSWRRAARDASDGAEAIYHDRKGAKKQVVKAGGGKNPRRIRKVFATASDAQAAADGAVRRDTRRAQEARCTLPHGNPALFPGVPVKLDGWKPSIDAMRWQIAEAVHKIDGSGGFATDVSLDLAD